MGVLERYLLREYLKIFLLSLSILCLIYLTIDFFEKIRRFADHDAQLLPILLYFGLKIPRVFFEMTPLAMLFSTVLAIGYFARTKELTAIKACGVSLHRALTPLLALAVLVGLVLLLANWSAIPTANRQSNMVRDFQIEKKPKSVFLKQERVWLRLDNRTFLNIQLIEPSQEVMRGITIYRVTPDFRLLETVEADELRFQEGRWSLHNGIQRHFEEDLQIKATRFESRVLPLERKPDEFQGILLREYEMTYGELDRYQKRLSQGGFRASRYQVEMASRTSLPFIGLIMMLIGIPSGLIGGQRAGVAKGIGACLLIALAYWLVFSVSISLGRGGVLSPFLAAWLPNITFGSVGSLLFLHMRQ